MSSYKDETHEILAGLAIPAPRSHAQQQILEAAKAQPHPQRHWLANLRRLRAAIYVPQTRYAIMASIVALFIGVGIINSALRESPSIPDELLLYDVEFATFDPASVPFGDDGAS